VAEFEAALAARGRGGFRGPGGASGVLGNCAGFTVAAGASATELGHGANVLEG